MVSTTPALSPDRCQEIILAIATEPQSTYGRKYKPDPQTIGALLQGLSPEDKADLVQAMLTWLKAPENHQAHPRIEGGCCGSFGVFQTLRNLLPQLLPLPEATLIELLILCRQRKPYFNHDLIDDFLSTLALPMVRLINHHLDAIELSAGGAAELSAPMRAQIEAACDYLDWHSSYETAITIRRRIGSEVLTLPLEAGEAWSDRAIADLDGLPPAEKRTWVTLLLACLKSNGSKPNKAWWATVDPVLAQLETTTLQQHLSTWFNLVAQPRTQPANPRSINVLEGYSRREGAKNDYVMDQLNTCILRGLCWLSSRYPSPEIGRGLGEVVLAGFRKVPGVGPVCIRLGNAALWALGQIGDRDSTLQLARLKAKVKLPIAQNSIAKALTATAQKSGVSLEELEELAVPDFDFAAVGQRQESLGDFIAEIQVQGNQASLNWFTAAGKPQKSVPKAVKEHYGEALKDLKQTLKDIQGLLPAQRDRLEAIYLNPKTWSFKTWCDRYLNHPLVGTLVRRLIWQFQTGDRTISAIWHQGQLVTVTGEPVGDLPELATVSLWHPITAEPDTVVAWRDWLVTHQVQQPFKQAHRELYLLTAAEQETLIYSNRFAAHIIKQPQHHALCHQRGWRDPMRRMNAWEDEPSVKSLQAWGLRAEFWLTGIGEDYDPELTTEAGGYRYLSTDQVRFYQLDRAELLPLETIPALVFSEVMRDVDLFVGVASVGNDPNWIDGGPGGHYRHYWHSYGFGDLSATAQTRRQVLAEIVPRLVIAPQCTLQDRFLVVQGQIRTYKIHLGSGNILMEPNDQYLCIVPSPRQLTAGEQVFLPFAGDGLTSIILSKALLLAADTKIKDPSIRQQIQP